MKPNLLPALLLSILLAASFAGCLNPAKHPAATTAEPPAPATPDASELPALVADGTVVAMPIHATFTSPGFVHYATFPQCVTPTAGACQIGARELLYATGDLEGSFVDEASGSLFADGSYSGTGVQSFTGSIAGCGSGVLHFTYDMAGGDPDPSHNGDTSGFDNLSMVAGAATTGFAGVVGANLLEEYWINIATGVINDATITGTVYCRVAAVPDLSPSHAGAYPVVISGKLTTPGELVVDQELCQPGEPGTCETYAHEFVYLSGNMNGSTWDEGHFHYNEDGSGTVSGRQLFTGTIEGCGSGELSFTYGMAYPATPGVFGTTVGVPGWDNLTLVPGSQTTGFAGFVDGFVNETYVINQVTFAATGEINGVIWCRPMVQPSVADAAAVKEIPIKVSLTTPGYLFLDQVYCDPADPNVCYQQYTERLKTQGSWTSSILDAGRTYFEPDGTNILAALDSFAGTIDGCGSGSFTMQSNGIFTDPTPALNLNGEVSRASEHWTLIPGSQSLGLANLNNVVADLDYTINAATGQAHGTLTGSVWCS